MAKTLSCKDAGQNCEWVGRAETEEELFRLVAEHARESHGIAEIPPAMLEMAKMIIKED